MKYIAQVISCVILCTILFSCSSTRKITKVDDLGFTVKITKAHERATFQANTTAFIAHSSGFQFTYVD